MTSTRERIPPHLRRYVVEQDYEAYDDIDQAVWRFVLLQTYARLVRTAHPAYVDGLAQTGISPQRIPSIDEMDRCLAELGWGAVAVDGFIPPRAFQEFQALGILTIAAEIRTAEHLAYTPAPDIIHESAGHAPIVPAPAYRSFLRRIGAVGARAFSFPEDRTLYQAIHQLSELKEQPHSTAAEIAVAERCLAEAQRAMTRSSEAALLSRLHWWTVEYGLVGTPQDYKIYGAGLLSSIGESHFLHEPSVRKLPLTSACIEVGYDITQPQPQLFVAESFDHLNAVLDEVASGLSQCRGGPEALRTALASREVATLELDSGLEITGILAAVHGAHDAPSYLRLSGPCVLSRKGRILPGHQRDTHPDGYGTPLGRLRDGSSLGALRASDLESRTGSRRASDLVLEFGSGVRVCGRLVDWLVDETGRLELLSFEACTVSLGDEQLFRPEWGRYDLAVGEAVRRAYAGPADPAYWPQTDFSTQRVPQPKQRGARGRELLELYREALDLCARKTRGELASGFQRIVAQLDAHFPDEWLLRWNLLESLCKASVAGDLASDLRETLLRIEERFPRDAPISTGLRYLDERYGAPAACSSSDTDRADS